MIDLMINLAGLLATAALLTTLIALEVRRAGPNTGQPTHPTILARTLNPKIIAAMWAIYLLLFLPRALGLLT